MFAGSDSPPTAGTLLPLTTLYLQHSSQPLQQSSQSVRLSCSPCKRTGSCRGWLMPARHNRVTCAPRMEHKTRSEKSSCLCLQESSQAASLQQQLAASAAQLQSLQAELAQAQQQAASGRQQAATAGEGQAQMQEQVAGLQRDLEAARTEASQARAQAAQAQASLAAATSGVRPPMLLHLTCDNLQGC